MNSTSLTANALKQLLQGVQAQGDSGLGEAVLVCCSSLVDSGETGLVIELVDEAKSRLPLTGELSLKLEVLRVRALRNAGQWDQSLSLARAVQSNREALLADFPEERYLLRIIESGILWQLNRVDEAIDRLGAIRHELLTRPESAALAHCTFELSSAFLFQGNLRPARDYSLEALVSARRCGHRLLQARALGNLSRIDRIACRWESARELASDSLLLYEAESNRIQASIARRSLAIVDWKRGHLAAASELVERCIADASGHDANHWYAHLLKCLILIHRGELETARRLLHSESAWTVPRSDSRPSLLTSEFIGDTYLEGGDQATALRHYEAVMPVVLALVPRGDIAAELRRRMAECLLRTGRLEDGYNEALRALEQCRTLGDRYEEAATYRVLGLGAALQGRDTDARTWFDLGFELFADIDTPYEHGKLWMAYAEWILGAHGKAVAGVEAQEALRSAEVLFERMGAVVKQREAASQASALRASDQGVAVVPGRTKDFSSRLRRPRGLAEINSRSAEALDTFKIVTRSKLVLDLLSEVEKLAISQTPILVLGESGTGKELIAEGAHRLSGRSGRFMAINCGAIPRDMVESELFGHVAGAFTGATKDKVGLLETCVGGTAFLDEIGEMAPDLQSKLLRFLESGEVRQVGSNRKMIADTLIIAATNRDRASLEAGDGFRTDLYYRLAHAVIVLPPLRKRGDDIDLLVSHFLAQFCGEYKKQVRLTDAARNRLIAYSWPGNVRQLKAALRRVVVLATESQPVGPEALDLNEAEVPATLSQELEQAEKRRIIEAIAQSRGVRAEAARILGMSRTTMLGKMKRYGIH